MTNFDENGLENDPIIFWDESITKGNLSKHKHSSTSEAALERSHGSPEQNNLTPLKENQVSADFQRHWSAAIHHQSYAQDSLTEVQAGVANFLKKNPSPAFDQRLANLMLYFLKNYINNNPDLIDRPFSERLEDACDMARQFILATNASQMPPSKDPE